MAGWKQKLTETARRNRVELLEAGLSRRELLQMGLLTGSGYLVAKLGLSIRAAGADPPVSPRITPWTEELPIPPVATPCASVDELGVAPQRICNRAMGEMGRSEGHQHWDQFSPANADVHLLDARLAARSWHRELPHDACWLFNGRFPGPRIQAHYGRPVMVRFQNNLPTLAAHRGYGRPTLSAHLQNAHTASESNGHPLDTVDPGSWRDHLYLNRRAGFTDPRFGPGGDVRETLTSLWYHDHCLGYTAQNVYRGSMGLYELFNEFDTGDENDPSPTAWRLPSGEFDVPLVLHDRVFDSLGKAYFDLFDLDGVLGDQYTVNGKILPFMRVARRKYRFRACNIGPSRFYDLGLSNGQSLVQVSHDGNMLPEPRTVQHFRMAVGQRTDVVVDFSGLASGTELYLVNRLEQSDGRGPTGQVLPPGRADRVLRFVVDGDLDTKGDPSRIPERFFERPPVDRSESATTRTFVFGRSHGGWTVNGKPFDPSAITATPRSGSAEIWNFVNDSGRWMHPVHIQLEEHQVLSRDGKAPSPDELVRQDVLWLGHGESVRVFLRFRDFLGRYVTHGQNALGGDHTRMFSWRVTP